MKQAKLDTELGATMSQKSIKDQGFQVDPDVSVYEARADADDKRQKFLAQQKILDAEQMLEQAVLDKDAEKQLRVNEKVVQMNKERAKNSQKLNYDNDSGLQKNNRDEAQMRFRAEQQNLNNIQ